MIMPVLFLFSLYEERAEKVAAFQASIDDLNNGHMVRDASEVERELRKELKLPEAKRLFALRHCVRTHRRESRNYGHN